MSELFEIYDHIPLFMLAFARLGGLFVFAPMLSSSIIPVRVRVGLAFIMALAVTPVLAASGTTVPESTLELSRLGPLLIFNATMGVAIGFIVNLPLVAVQTGGLMVAQQMGLGFAQFFNPAVDDEADVLAQLLFFMALATFLMIGGHEAMFIAVLCTFEHLAIDANIVNLHLIDLIGALLNSAMELAMRIAAPVIALTFLESLALGYVSKTVPQLNILSLGFPIRIMLGFGMLMFGVAVINDVLTEEFGLMLDALFTWIEDEGHRHG